MSTQTPHPGRPAEPAQLAIQPGLTTILTPRQIGLFPAFRAALLEAAAGEFALRNANWLGRDEADFGVMLTEMFAYLCDVLAFYDGFLANEAYLRTAQRTVAARRLVGLIGYLPRPAVAAQVDLALSLEGRLPVPIPAGTAFRSASFTAAGQDEKPQVFTARTAAEFHPLRTKFTLASQPSAKLAGAAGSTLLRQALSCQRGSVTVKAGDPALVRTGARYAAALVAGVENTTDPAGNPLTEVKFGATLALRGGTPLSDTAVLRPTGTAFVNDDTYTYSADKGFRRNGVYLDARQRSIKTGDVVLLRKGAYVRWFRVTADTHNWTVQPAQTINSTLDGKPLSTTVPAVTTPVTRLIFDTHWDDPARRAPEDTASWLSASLEDFTVYFGMSAAAVLAGKAAAKLAPGDVLKVREPVQPVPASLQPQQFILRDLDENAIRIDGALAADGTLTIGAGSGWTDALTPPVTVYGAILRATRGEQVAGERLGVGNGGIPNQTFKLKKKPLSYLSAPASETGVQSTLELYVDGVRWREVPRLFGRGPTERVYVVRQNEEGESLVTFGDGVQGQRLSTGAQVVAGYTFGAGAAAPPARTVTQMVTPVKGVTAVVNPLSAFGGADAEDEAGMKQYAPRAALMLGRAVSLVDYEAAAAAVPGVRAAKAEWRWSGAQQQPVVQLWYSGEGELGAVIGARLREISAEGVPFAVTAAQAIEVPLHVTLAVDPDYLPEPVEAEVVSVLTAALAPETMGLGAPLIRSKVLALAAGVEGVTAPTGLVIDGAPYLKAGQRPPAGSYFVFAPITAGF